MERKYENEYHEEYARMNRARSVGEFERMTSANSSTMVHEEAHIANPLEYPLENMTAARNFWRAAFVLLATVVAGMTITNVMWWFGGAR